MDAARRGMKHVFLRCAAWMVVMAGIAVPVAGSAGESFPFFPGEKMQYRVRWNFITAGTGVMEVLPMTEVKGEKAYHFILTAQTNSFIDIFYKVRDRYDSYADATMSRSLMYRRLNEGKDRRNVMVFFDWPGGTVWYSNMGEARAPVPVLPGSFDPLSVYYAFRMMDFKEGDSIEMPVTDGKKSVMGRATVVGREPVDIDGTVYDTYRIEPELKHFGGVFKKSTDNKLAIWITADERKIPVKMEVEVVIGSVVFECISYEGRRG